MDRRLRVHWFQHVPFEGLGSIAPWLEQIGADVSMTAFWRGDLPPAPESFDWLIIMGGPMSVHDEAAHPWLRAEKEIIRQAISQNKVVLGICLGAQLIAEALGGQVMPNPQREIGWFSVDQTPDAKGHPLGTVLPHDEPVFHWHGETFTLPAGAIHLASSAACIHQAFAVGDRVIGLQFHLEITPASAAALVENCVSDLTPGLFVHSAQGITGPAASFTRINAAMERLLAALASRRS